ncbi:PepSY-associated TM helix domain-containing protein [Anaerophaga thermohalophila]|uniref:PepSY-associated TM helix domain-containing protein n=1 Tax=Anaerophaga thermohalophila TaxID=177400 RepID=UPI00030E331B|nr:PepSY-associated TM helix domain-containing protein [Anaerophaga thermohalophila]
MIKKITFQLHLWLGLLSGIVVFIVSITGSIYVFQPEIISWLRHEAIYADNPQKKTPLSQHRLWETARANLSEEEKISWVNIYNDSRKNQIFYSYDVNPNALTYFGFINHYKALYINPYNGEIEGAYNEETGFFNIVKILHWSLLLKTSIGQPIVGWATLIFVILLITGLILWWPKSFRGTKNLLLIRWKKTTSLYKKFYDLHNVLGFWSLTGTLIIALTGMVWAFNWFQALVYVTAAGTTIPPKQLEARSKPGMHEIVSPIDIALIEARQKYIDAAGFRIIPPSDSTDAINIYVQQKEGLYYINHQLQFDQYSGKLLGERKHDDKNAGEKLISANYDIHTGAILGLPGRILAFIVSLIAASLPVTGFMMWWKRKRKRQSSLF